MIRSTRRLLTGCVLGSLAVLGPSPAARAESWIFRPSYFTHEYPTFVPRSFGPAQAVYPNRTGPYVTRPQGAYVRGGWRHTRSYLRAGDGRENNNYFESYIQFGEQF